MPLDPEDLEKLRRRAKVQIRTRMRSLRAAVPAPARAARCNAIIERVSGLPVFQQASALALFWPMSDEVDLRPLDTLARNLKKRVYYPVLDRRDGGLFSGLALSERAEELAERGSRFAEPPPEAPRAVRGEVELVIAPALAVSADGHRLGYGRGFYDSLLPDFRPPARALIVAFDFQLLVELPLEPHDVACDLVVTDQRTLAPS